VSETKETEADTEALAEGETEAEAEGKSEAEGEADADAEGEREEAGSASEEPRAPKKKKKKAREQAEPETIKDRNARVRAEAVEKRRARREREQGAAPRRNLDASEVMDDALARSTHAAANLLTKHFNKVQWVLMAGLVGWIAFEVYTWRHARTSEKASDILFKALSAEMGKVGEGEPDVGEERGTPADTRRPFASDEERLRAAKSEYELASTTSGEPTSVLADLGAAGVAYDLGQYKDAEAGFDKVRRHAAFATDNDIKGRTLEGLGMSLEAQKNDDGALKAFKELANMDGANFSALGLYHQARILKGQGKTEDALKLLEKAGSKLETLKETPGAIRYLGASLMELLESIDPNKARELSKKLMSSEMLKKMTEGAAASGPGGQKGLSPEIQKKLEELMKNSQPSAPAEPAPMPGPVLPPMQEAPAPDAPQDAPPPSDAPAPAPSGAP
jgi:tetratricopeptide (TPR) repeat protein